ncbi:MAG TPA: hypothetical protein VL970_05055 [Candidatus Acidoferrales bacterium]|nr:hypothetical protein [Candidatus Acidoferrales bacterium]
MGIVNFILNLAGLLLWLNWRSNRFDPLVRRRPATLMGTLRPAAPQKLRRWQMLAFIAILLVLRAVIYWWVGRMFPKVWVGQLDLGLTTLPFRSDLLVRMLLFSFLSFGVLLGVFYMWVLALSVLAGPLPIHALVTIPLGRLDRWPAWAKIILPFLTTAVLWWLASWLLIRMDILTPVPPAGRFQQSLVLGVSTYLLWQYPFGIILLLYLLNSYIYFGRHPFWSYVSATAHTILRPLKKAPLRLGRVDFAPLVGIALIFGLACAIEFGLPPHRGGNGQPSSQGQQPSQRSHHIPGLVDLYQRLPF